MFPRKPLFLWQQFAQGLGRAKTGFAPTRLFSQGGGHDDRCSGPCGRGLEPHCDPFPLIWLSPLGVGPFFCDAAISPVPKARNGRGFADDTKHFGDNGLFFAFPDGHDALDSGAITTSNRGKLSCGNLSLSFLLQRRLPAACKTPARAPWLVRSPARSLQMRPTAMSRMAPSLAVWPVSRPAPSRARSAANFSDLTVKPAGRSTTSTTQGAFPFGWFFHISPSRAALT